MNPMLASDWIPAKVKFPIIAQPKIDGVRAMNMTGVMTGRSLKKFKNEHITKLFSHSGLMGFDGELAHESAVHPDLCRITSSATARREGSPYMVWWLFDYVTTVTRDMTYNERLFKLHERMAEIEGEIPHLFPHLRIIPFKRISSMDELEQYDAENLAKGYEGTCFRSPDRVHKQGRSTPTEGGLLRIKRFVDFEFCVEEIIEGEENTNEAQINELGLTFRSSHQENMVANGMIGAMIGRTLNVVKDGEKVLFEKGAEVRVGAGRLSHEQRKHYFKNPEEFKAMIHKAKFFPKGIKDKPRFPTWQSSRDIVDMS